MMGRLGGKSRQREEDSVRRKAADRLGRVSTGQVMNWADEAVTGFYRSMDAYRMRNDQAALEELRKAVSMLAGALDVLEQRNQV
jgi:hypothetical protein